ncbi:rRNA maturation RNase YbeY [Candidatus Phytoplasma asteris]|uniref:Endoribonuclease YbeY n=1 Tax=Candidatus Phytoplasma asteris TaxID=85620 RepID=A0ABZ2YGR4_9MOLU
MIIKIHNQTSFCIKPFKSLLIKMFLPIKEKKIMHLIFVTNEKIQELNSFYRQKNYPTDVLSFHNDLTFFAGLEDNSLGDVFISFPKAQEQAKAFKHSLEREIAFLAVHGFLHLKGYQHRTEEEFQIMLALQEKILQKVGLNLDKTK